MSEDSKLRHKTRHVQRSMADLLEMPKEIVLDLPKVTIVGALQLVVENHKGIIEYTADKVRVSVANGEIEISGRNLILETILPEEISLEGEINSIFFRK